MIYLFLLCLLTFQSLFANYVVVKSDTFSLELYNEEHSLLKSYTVGLGKGGMGKNKQGDMKTPLGEYRLIWKASSFWKEDGGLPIEAGRGYIGPDNAYSERPRPKKLDGPLNGEDYGGNSAIFMCLDYPNATDHLNGYTGFGIAIHASLKGGFGEFSSRGCIRMHPEDARELYTKLPVGAKVIIK